MLASIKIWEFMNLIIQICGFMCIYLCARRACHVILWMIIHLYAMCTPLKPTGLQIYTRGGKFFPSTKTMIRTVESCNYHYRGTVIYFLCLDIDYMGTYSYIHTDTFMPKLHKLNAHPKSLIREMFGKSVHKQKCELENRQR